jgi:hypothetical protein
LHDEELHNFYSSSDIISMIMSRRMKWAGHVSCMGTGGMHIGFCWKGKKEIYH